MAKYKRQSDGKFAGGSTTTVKQGRAKNSAVKKKMKDDLSGGKLGGKGKRKRQGARAKVRGTKVTTGAARKSADRSKKRFG